MICVVPIGPIVTGFTPEDETILNGRLDLINDRLEITKARYQLGSTATDDCAFFRACPNNIGFGTPLLDFTSDPHFGNLSVNREQQIFKQSKETTWNQGLTPLDNYCQQT